MNRVPRIESATAIAPARLPVLFEDGSRRVYDCGPLLDRPRFQLLNTAAFFQAVRVDAGGYGVSWNDDIDLSEYEIWTNGIPADGQQPCQPPAR